VPAQRKARRRIDAIEVVATSVKRLTTLPGRHPVTQLLIDYFHGKYNYQMNEGLINEIRQMYVIPGLRTRV